MSQPIPFERRAHPRSPVVRACKVRPRGALRFDAGATDDASWGGVSLTVRTNRRFTIGDHVELVVAWEGEPVVKQEPVAARVRRVLMRPHGEQRIGVELVRESQSETGTASSAA
jgi:hypothetical protein